MLKNIISGLILVALVSACSSTPKSTDPNKLTDIQTTQTISVKWRANIGKTDTLAFSPTYYQGSIFAADERGQIYELDYASGRVLSSFDSKTRLVSGIAVLDDTVFVGDKNAKLLAYSRQTRQKTWEQTLTTTLAEAPMLVGNVLVTKTKDGRLSGFNPQTGQTLWTFANNQSALNIRNTGTMTPISEQLFLTAQPGGGLVVVNAQNGETIWGVIVATPKGASDLERVTEVLSRPVLADGMVCAVAYQGRVGCFDVQSGRTQWAQPASSSKGLAAAGSLLILTEDDGTIKAYNRSNGQVFWHNTDLKNRNTSAPVILPSGILVTDLDGVAHLIDYQTGSLIGRHKLGNLGSLSAQPQRIEYNALLQGQKGDLILVQTSGNNNE